MLGKGTPAELFSANLSIPPTLPDQVVRYRLLEQLDQGVRRKLTLISAPAGFGKTTLIASWLHQLKERKNATLRTAWLSLEENDNDPVSFCNRFITALWAIDRMIGQTARPFLETPHPPKLDHVMRLLIEDLAASPEQSLIVLDDFHAINHPELQTALEYFLHHSPPQCRMILLTRHEPSLPLSRLREQWEVAEIRLQDLRFSGEETETFLNRTMGMAVSAEAVQTLVDRTKGWVAGLQMAALAFRGRSNADDFSETSWEMHLGRNGAGSLIDHLAAEALNQQPPEIRNFLRQTAIVDRFNVSLCDAVTERNGSSAMLRRLQKANLFLIPLDNERRWHRYHHLFSDFLRAGLSDAERITLHGRASHWYEAQGLITDAIRHSLAASNPGNAVRLIRERSIETLRNGGFATIRSWISSLPEETVREHSDIAVSKGWVLCSRGEIAAAESYARLAVRIQRPDEPLAARGKLLSFRSFLELNRGDHVNAAKFAQDALELLHSDEDFHKVTALTHLGQARRLAGDREGAIQTLREATVLGQRQGNHLISLEALAYLTALLYQRGDLSEALLMCEQAANRYLDPNGNPLPVAGMVCASLGALYYQINDLERAFDQLTIGLNLCRHIGILGRALIGQCTLAKLHFARGETDAMREALAQARRLAARSENQRRNRVVDVITADIQLRQGQISAASLTLAKLPIIESERSVHENLTFARWLLAQDNVEEAQKILQRLEQITERQRRRCNLITIHLLQALAYKRRRRAGKSLGSLEAAISLGGPEGYFRLFLDEDPVLARMLPARRSLAPKFVDGLLKAFSNAEPLSAPTTDSQGSRGASVDPLTKTELEVLRLVAEGLSNRAVAGKLDITEGTTKWHLNHIYNKLNVNSRTQAIAEARKLDYL